MTGGLHDPPGKQFCAGAAWSGARRNTAIAPRTIRWTTRILESDWNGGPEIVAFRRVNCQCVAVLDGVVGKTDGGSAPDRCVVAHLAETAPSRISTKLDQRRHSPAGRRNLAVKTTAAARFAPTLGIVARLSAKRLMRVPPRRWRLCGGRRAIEVDGRTAVAGQRPSPIAPADKQRHCLVVAAVRLELGSNRQPRDRTGRRSFLLWRHALHRLV